MSGDGLTLIERLAQHLQRPVPDHVRTRARLHLLDWLACVAGAREWRRQQGIRKMPIVHHGYAMLGNVLEMDDVHRTALLHPGPVIWATALRNGGPAREPMRRMLDDAVVGYEAMITIGATFDDHHYSHYHPTATAGPFGAVAAFGRSWMSEAQISNALALAGSVVGGLWQTRHTFNHGKQWHVAHAHALASTAAIFAADGVRGPLDVLEGPQGLYAATCRQPKSLILGPGWRIEEVSFKPWAACRHAHPAIDCALELRALGELAPPFQLETYRDALIFCDKPHPETEVEAKFSLQHAVAVVADGRNATPADFTTEAIAALAPLRALVTVAEALEITARYPARFGARLNGFELLDCRGDPERPVGEADIVAKMRMLAGWGGLPTSEADRAADLALRGDDASAVNAMLEAWLK